MTIDDYKLKLITPTGAPAVAFLNYLNYEHYDTNTVPNNIVAEMIKGTYDIVVVDLIGGLTAIEKKNAEYMRKWRAEHPDKFKRIQEKSNLKYRMKNRKKIAKRQKKYYDRHREEILQRLREKRSKQREERKNEK